MRPASEILIFKLGDSRYALPSSDVRELLRAVAILPLPKAPPIVEGIINVRGAVVPVLDVRARFRIPPKVPTHTDHLVLARARGRLVALRVDRALEVVRVDPGDLEGPEAVGTGAAYVAGVAKLPDGLVLVHDLGMFLDAAEAAALDEAVSGASIGGA